MYARKGIEGSNPSLSVVGQMIKPGKYKHYSGRMYELVGVAHHSETLEEMVVYRALYDSPDFGKNAIWVRPIKMFLESVIVDGKALPRFEYVGE